MATATAFKIESADLSLRDVFKDFYVVPDFQREYVWKEDDVIRLLQDASSALLDEQGHVEKGKEYFIGSIVVTRDSAGVYQLIDGQQRLTTCYLLECAVRDVIAESGSLVPQWLEQTIASTSSDLYGNDVFRHRLELQYEDSHGVLVQVAKSKGAAIEDIERTTSSIDHLLNAYSAIRTYLPTEFDNDVSLVRGFIASFNASVKMIRIVTPDLSQALKVFETINDRGVGLNAMDLLKNLLFMNLEAEEYPSLKVKWKRLMDLLQESKEKPLRFLRYFVMANFEVDGSRPLPEDEIYEWLSTHADDIGIADDPLKFVELLCENAEAYRHFSRNEHVDGTHNRFLRNLEAFNGSSRQHYMLLLAGRHFDEETFTLLSQHLENYLFCLTVTRTPAKYFEARVMRWSGLIRKSRTSEDLMQVLQDTIHQELAQKSSDFDYAFLQLDQKRILKYRMRYVLAKLTQHVNWLAWHNAEDLYIDKFLDKSVEVEHILPQVPNSNLPNEFDLPDQYDEYKVRLGNLTLLEKTINASISNGTFSSKVDGYRESQFLLTRAIFDKPAVGYKTAFNAAVEKLPQFAQWDSGAIERRQDALRALAREVWSIPATDS